MKYFKKYILIFAFVMYCLTETRSLAATGCLPESGTTGKCGEKVTWTYLDNEWVNQPGIYISGTETMYDYNEGEAPWSQYAAELEQIVVCNGVTYIGKNAFYGMKGLRRLVIGDTVTHIDDTALDGCSKELTIYTDSSYAKAYAEKHGYQVIEGYAESSALSAQKKNLSKGNLNYIVTSTKKDSYEVMVTGSRSKKKTLVIPATISVGGINYKVTAIAENAFKNNQTIKKITIGKNVSCIGKQAFYNCKKVNKITIKTSKLTKKRIGKNAFSRLGKNNYKKLIINVPADKQKDYLVMLRKKGLSDKVKVY